jgi:hypothetical protein
MGISSTLEAGDFCFRRFKISRTRDQCHNGTPTNTPTLQLLKYNTMATVIFAVVMLHLLVGFGYVMYKLTGSDSNQG